MNEFRSTRTNYYRDGKTKDIEITVLTCATCNQFVMSEDVSPPAISTSKTDNQAGV